MTVYPRKIMLLGSGELGKEVAIEAKRLGCTVIACDRYPDAPAMQIADISEVIDMNNSEELKCTVKKHNPEILIPEIEALAVNALIELEESGFTVIPNARATQITMNRDKIRDLASKELNLKTANFKYASNNKELEKLALNIGLPVIVKPVMSSSGKGQSLITNKKELSNAWLKAIEGSRGQSNLVIIEEFIKFDLEITLLTIRQKDGSVLFCPPIGHEQSGGDYQCSWQPASLTDSQLTKAQEMALIVTNNLGGVGLFGVEFFIRKDEIIFSELSPRPHDTGLVTLMSQNISEFELHLRAILGIPIPNIELESPSATRVILSKENYLKFGYKGIEKALIEPNTKILLFGKPKANKGRRMGVAIAKGKDIKEAQNKANKSAENIEIIEQ